MDQRRFIIIFLGRAFQFLLALATLKVATTLLSPVEVGKMSLVVTTTAFFAFFLISPVGMFINRRLHAWMSNGVAWYYLKWYLLYLAGVIVTAVFCLIILFNLGSVDFGITLGWLLLLICGSLFFGTINQTAIPSLNLLGFSGWFVLLTLATLILSLGCAYVLTDMFLPNAPYWLLGILFGQVVLAVVGSRVLFIRLKQGDVRSQPCLMQKANILALFGFAWPLAIAAGLGWIQSQGYRYFIEADLGLDQLGLFVAGYGLSAGMIAGFESVLTTYFQPRLYRDANSDNTAERSRAWKQYAVAIVPSLFITVALITLLAPELVRIILGENFQSAAEYVVWGAFAEAARVMVGIYSLNAHVHMKTRSLVIPNLIGALLSLSMCFLLIPMFGADGAGAALVISGLAMVILMHLLLSPKNDDGHTTAVQPISFAVLLIMALWLTVTGMRYVFDANGWWSVIGIVVTTGLFYCAFQYFLLRNSLRTVADE